MITLILTVTAQKFYGLFFKTNYFNRNAQILQFKLVPINETRKYLIWYEKNVAIPLIRHTKLHCKYLVIWQYL